MTVARQAITGILGLASSIACAAGSSLAADASGGTVQLSAETSSLLSAIVKVSGSLLVVVGIMLLVLYAIKRTGLGSGLGSASSAITVLETRMVAPKKYIAIVDVAGHCLALGITDHAINLLSELGPEATATLINRQGPAASGFAGLLRRSMRNQQASPNLGDPVPPTANQEAS